MASLVPLPKFYATDDNGRPVPGGKLFTYEANSSTKLDTYTTSAGNVANTNPVLMDTAGRANVWLDGSKLYKWVFSPADDTDPPTNPFWTVDNIGFTAEGVMFQQTGSGSIPRSVQDKLEEISTPGDFGAVGNLTTNDEDAILLAQGSRVPNNWESAAPYGVEQLIITGNELSWDARGFWIKGVNASGGSSVVDVKCGYSTLRNLRVDANLNTDYECAVHWYTNDLNLYYPGFNAIRDGFIRYAEIGLCVGALPSQADPIPPQGDSEPEGIATDAPLSESSVSDLKFYGCLKAIYARQPNGKLTLLNCTVSGATNEWVGNDPGDVCALVVLSSTLIHVKGGSLIQVVEDLGKLFQLGEEAGLYIDGPIFETVATSYQYDDSILRIANTEMGLNVARFLEISSTATQYFDITDCRVLLANGGSATNPSFIRSVDGFGGTTTPNLDFIGNFTNVELRNAPFRAGSSVYAPLCDGFRTVLKNCTLTAYSVLGVFQSSYRLDESGPNLLAGVVDTVATSIAAPSAGAADGGWTFSAAGAGNWGKITAGLPSPKGETVAAAIILDATGGGGDGATVVSTTFFFLPQEHYPILRFYAKTGGSGGTVRVRMYWYDFDGVANATASTDLYTGTPGTLAGTSYTPIMLLLLPPSGAYKAKIEISIGGGASIYVANPAIR